MPVTATDLQHLSSRSSDAQTSLNIEVADRANPTWVRYAPRFVQRKLESQPNLLPNLHNIGWLLADKVLRIAVAVVIGSWFARYLGPDQFGELSYILTFVAIFGVACQLGLDAVVIREIASDREASPAILGTTFRLRLFVSFVAWIACVSSMSWLRAGDLNAIWLTAILAGTIVFQSADTVDVWFQSQTQSARTVTARIASYLIGATIKTWLILTKASLVAFAIATLLEAVIAAIGLWIGYRRMAAPGKWCWDAFLAKRLVAECWPYMLSSLAIVIYLRIDQIMIRELVSTHEVGIYSSAFALSTALYFIPVAISMTLAPSIARLKNADSEGFERRICLLYSLMWWVSIPMAITISLLAGPLVGVLYGNNYAAASSVLAIHIFTLIPVAVGTAQGSWLVNERRSGLALSRTLLGGICSVLLNLWLVPQYGAKGAAISAVVSFSISSILSNLLFAPRVFRMQVVSLFEPVWRLTKVRAFQP